MYPDLAGVAALITALGTLVLVLVNHEKNKGDAAASITEAAASITEAAEKRIDQLNHRVECLEKRVTELEQENSKLREGVRLLITQICSLGHTPAWRPDWDKD